MPDELTIEPCLGNDIAAGMPRFWDTKILDTDNWTRYYRHFETSSPHKAAATKPPRETTTIKRG